MSRFDLAHVDPTEIQLRRASARASRKASSRSRRSNKYLSKGLTRSRTDNLVVMRGGSEPQADARGGSGNVTAMASHGPTARAADAVEGAVALKQEAQHDLSPTEKLEALQWSKAGAAAQPRRPRPNAAPKPRPRATKARCAANAGNFTLVRNGTCMKCDTCGSTTGCS